MKPDREDKRGGGRRVEVRTWGRMMSTKDI